MGDRRPCKAQHRIADALSPILETLVDPCCVKLWPARGYWTHSHQDVQRWTGSVEVEGIPFSLGSWDLTLSDLRKGNRFVISDNRRHARPYNDFSVEKP